MDASRLSERLAQFAEEVCRHYLPNGRREGRSWRVGDVRNAPGRSVAIRLMNDAAGRRAGKWQDLATGEHGDLLDIIREAKSLRDFSDVLAEARRFLAEPLPEPRPDRKSREPVPAVSAQAARRLAQASMPIVGTLAQAYLRNRGITNFRDVGALRFHSRCYYGGSDAKPGQTWPAMIASVTDASGQITGVHRTYLDPNGFDDVRLGKAPVECPRRSMGDIHGHGVRFGLAADVMAAGEGIETVRSLKEVLPAMSMISALSTSHLAQLILPAGLRRLYIIEDDDPAGIEAANRLADRARATGVDTITLSTLTGDLNDDLRTLGIRRLAAHIGRQLSSEDASRFSRGGEMTDRN